MYKTQKRNESSSQKTKFSQFSKIRPLIRACGCEYRFQPAGSEKKQLTVHERRSGGCTSNQKNDDTQTAKSVLKDHNPLENNLHQKQIIEIREIIELACYAYHHQSNRKLRSPSNVIPNRYATTIHINLNSSAKRFIEEVSLQVCPSPIHPDCRSIYKFEIETTMKQTLAGNVSQVKKITIHFDGSVGKDEKRIT